jgi:hypothetical protein
MHDVEEVTGLVVIFIELNVGFVLNISEKGLEFGTGQPLVTSLELLVDIMQGVRDVSAQVRDLGADTAAGRVVWGRRLVIVGVGFGAS